MPLAQLADALNQFNGEFHANFCAAVACSFDAGAGLVGDGDAGDFVV